MATSDAMMRAHSEEEERLEQTRCNHQMLIRLESSGQQEAMVWFQTRLVSGVHLLYRERLIQ
jgi:hypothetical protein